MQLSAAVRAVIIGDATLAAKVGTAVYPSVVPQNPPDYSAVTKIISNMSWKKLDGATTQSAVRIEVTFWGIKSDDTEALASRLGVVFKGFNGTMGGGGGVDFATHQIMWPRSMYNPENRMYGWQVDILGVVDMGTVS